VDPVIAIEPLTAADAPAVARWLSVPAINEWLTADWRGRTVDASLLGIAMRNKRNRLFLVRDGGAACGLVALADWEPADRVAMVWYALGETNLGGKGVITTALKQLVALAFRDLEIESLYAYIRADNERSRRVLEKCGFREVGRMRAAVRKGGEQLDRVYFDLVRGDPAAQAALGA
jgi:RimJ/RimL family protein N-acetyltransferase